MNELSLINSYHTFLKKTKNELSLNEFYQTFSYEHDEQTFHKRIISKHTHVLTESTRQNNSYWTATNHVLTWIDLKRSKTLNLVVFSGEESCDPPCSILTAQTLSLRMRSFSRLPKTCFLSCV